MKVFLSWSGDHSRAVAVALRDWLPSVINSVQPFVSARDIYAGSRWQNEIASQLETTDFGIVCVTRKNQAAPWLNFEVGAIAKAVDSSRVVPLAIDLKPSDIELPLGQFQAQPATEAGVGEILTSINSSSDPRLADELLTKASAKWWPDLEDELAQINAKFAAASPRPTEPDRTERELLEEVLDTVRGLARRRADVGVVPLGAAHPVLDQILAVAASEDPQCFVLPSVERRAVGVFSEQLSDSAVDRINALAEQYGAQVDYVLEPPRKRVRRKAPRPQAD